MSYRISVRRDTAANWTANNPTLGQGEIGYEYDDNKLKIGDGTSNWTNLEYFPDVTGVPATSVLVYAKASEAITKGDLVMFAGAQGSNILIAKADNTTAGFIDQLVVGVAQDNIPLNGFGYVTDLGPVQGLDTSAWTEGDLLWMDVTTPGALTNVKPLPPEHSLLVAAVTHVNPTNGDIFVRISFGSDLADIHDVNLTTPATDGQVLSYDAATSNWTPTSISVDGGSA